jgi:hypothetical protein
MAQELRALALFGKVFPPLSAPASVVGRAWLLLKT